MKISRKSKKWRTYEDVSQSLLCEFRNYFGLADVESKQRIHGDATTWEIDAKGVVLGRDGFIIVECRCYIRNKISQEQIGGLAYRIRDTGAEGGILVSPLGFQKGAKLVANKESILEVRLNPNSTTANYIFQFLNNAFAGLAARSIATASISLKVIRADGTVEAP